MNKDLVTIAHKKDCKIFYAPFIATLSYYKKDSYRI